MWDYGRLIKKELRAIFKLNNALEIYKNIIIVKKMVLKIEVTFSVISIFSTIFLWKYNIYRIYKKSNFIKCYNIVKLYVTIHGSNSKF